MSFDLCPYVQRAAIVLTEKELPFERIRVELTKSNVACADLFDISQSREINLGKGGAVIDVQIQANHYAT